MYSKDKFIGILKSYKYDVKSKSKSSEEIDNLKHLAKVLGVHVNTVHNWVHSNTVPNIEVAEYVLNQLGYDLQIVKKV